MAKSAKTLYDMKFIEVRKYEASIFDQAVGMVAGRVPGVALGAFRDDRFDFRANLIIAKAGDNNEFQYVLLNTGNTMIRHYWDEFFEVQPKVDEMKLSVEELSEYFEDAEIRSGEYVKNSVALNKVRALIGNTPIEQVKNMIRFRNARCFDTLQIKFQPVTSM